MNNPKITMIIKNNNDEIDKIYNISSINRSEVREALVDYDKSYLNDENHLNEIVEKLIYEKPIFEQKAIRDGEREILFELIP